MFRVGIVGGGGYTAGELIRLLLRHPAAEIAFVQSKSQNGKPVHDIHTDLVGDTDLHFSDEIDESVDVLFLCMGHGASKTFMESHFIRPETLIIDLSHDFRLNSTFVYGLPELHREAIQQSRRIANPGCFATAIQLALLPLAKQQLIQSPMHVNAITGSTGAGQALQPTLHFSWRNNNVSVYKPFQHQHLAEIGQSLRFLYPEMEQPMHFIPVRGGFTRGIFASVYLQCELELLFIREIYRDFYHNAVFTHLTDTNPDVKQVVNTNKCLLYLEKHEGQILILSVIDNLLKGASGQAVQNMNLALGLPEVMGLDLKAAYF